jgi:transposase
MRAFGTEISGNRRPGGELSTQQRDYVLAQTEAGARTKEIADTLGCSQRCVQKTIQRWEATGSNELRPRLGRTPVLTRRDRRLLLRLAKKSPKIEYCKLLEEAGMWPASQDHPNVSCYTVQRLLL